MYFQRVTFKLGLLQYNLQYETVSSQGLFETKTSLMASCLAVLLVILQAIKCLLTDEKNKKKNLMKLHTNIHV